MERSASMALALALVGAHESSVLAESAATRQEAVAGPTRPTKQPHVRSTERWIQTLIQQGRTRSATFQRLVDTLDSSDVIAYIVWRVTPEGMGGFLTHNVVVNADVRYVWIAVSRQGDETRAIGIIAHELQHAVEIANASEVGRTTSATEFFARINQGGCHAGGLCYETAAALAAQRAVMKELLEGSMRPDAR